jgi:hypothetical protein
MQPVQPDARGDHQPPPHRRVLHPVQGDRHLEDGIARRWRAQAAAHRPDGKLGQLRGPLVIQVDRAQLLEQVERAANVTVVESTPGGQLLVGRVIQHIACGDRLPGEGAEFREGNGAAAPGHRRQHGADALLEVAPQQRLAPPRRAQRRAQPWERLEHPGPGLQRAMGLHSSAPEPAARGSRAPDGTPLPTPRPW